MYFLCSSKISDNCIPLRVIYASFTVVFFLDITSSLR